MKYNIKKVRESKVFHEIADVLGHTIYLYDNDGEITGQIHLTELCGKVQVMIQGWGKKTLEVSVECRKLTEQPSHLSVDSVWRRFSG